MDEDVDRACKMSFKKLKRKVEKARELGLFNIFMCIVTRFSYQRLHKKYNFDPWHYEGTFYCRPYQRKAVLMVNKMNPRTVVEIGCGLGEIISRVEAPKRVGYDLEQQVIDAAKYLYGSRVEFKLGSGYEVKETKIDVLIAINWIHNLSPKEIREFLEPFYNRATYFLLEGITPGEPGYKFYHDFSFLDGHAELVGASPGGMGEPRTLMLYKLENEF
jgi:hypothetical protein